MKGLIEKSEVKRLPKYLSKRTISYLIIGTISLIFTIYLSSSWETLSNTTIKVNDILNKPETAAVKPSSYGTQSNNAHKIYFDEQFREKAAQKFSGAIQIETESYDDNPNPSENIKPWLKFYKFHDYLKKTYPLVHKHLSLEKPNKVGLLYTWEGLNPDLKPLLLTAHQDVIPVDPLTLNKWTYAPYSGYYDGKYVWGRGTVDCKELLIAILQAVESLLEDGFKPERTIVLGFGSDEETNGKFGAKYIGEALLEKYGPDSFYALSDEGSSIISIDDEWYATPATTEKGHVQIEIQLTTPGGHSSVPPDHTSIGIAAKLITLIENNPFEPILSSKNPYLRLLQEVAKYSKNISEDLRNDILKAEFDPEANKRTIEYITQKIPTKYLIQTSQSVGIIHGGVKSNALPEFVEISYDSRISIDQTVQEVVDHVLVYIKQISEEFGLGLSLNNETLIEKTEKGYFNVNYEGLNTLPITPDHGNIWDLYTGTIKHVWEDIIFSETNETIHVAPSLLTPNTDTKHYLKLTSNIFRFFPMRMSDIFATGVHSVDEHLELDQHLEAIAFMYEFIQNANEAN